MAKSSIFKARLKTVTVLVDRQLYGTLSDLWPGCQGRDIFEVEYRKNVAS